jgi:2-hydroxychromene-2-carboxylate isomerase
MDQKHVRTTEGRVSVIDTEGVHVPVKDRPEQASYTNDDVQRMRRKLARAVLKVQPVLTMDQIAAVFGVTPRTISNWRSEES